MRLAANAPRYYHGDGLGSITAVSNGKGDIVATNEYDHWGNITASTGTTPQFGYTGREPDATGFVYYRNRYYDPQIGRFTQLDPKGFIDGVNRYAYVMNSPVNYVDPWGLSANKWSDASNAGGYVDVIQSGSIGYLETLFPSIHQPKQQQSWSVGAQEAYYQSPEFQNQGRVGNVVVVDLFVGGPVAKGVEKGVSFGTGLFGRVFSSNTGSALATVSSSAFRAADNVVEWTPKNKHLLDSTAKRAAKFNTNDIDDVRSIVSDALRSPNAKFMTNNIDSSFRVVTDMGKEIGSKGQTTVRTIVGNDGEKIWNSFPVNVK